MKTKEITIHQGEYLQDALAREGIKNIPTNTLLDKRIPGLGATYMELHSRRNSIIIEPNVPVIKGKESQGKDEGKQWFGIYSGVYTKKMLEYLTKRQTSKKILTTPEGFMRLRNVAKEAGLWDDMKRSWFCLYDEINHVIEDVSYRDAITAPMQELMEFQGKALVSATPLPMSETTLQGFTHLRVVPDWDYRENLRLLFANNFLSTFKHEIDNLAESQCVVIFYNSVHGIDELIKTYHLEDDSQMFCSAEAQKKFAKKNCGYQINSELRAFDKKYNFLTSRYFSAVDIELDVQPDVLILTDLYNHPHSMVDPFTDVIQAQGRFRRSNEEGKRFRSLCHITNVNEDLASLDAEKKQREHATRFLAWQTLMSLPETYSQFSEQCDENMLRKIAKEVAANYINKDGRMNSFRVDYDFNELRVRRSYAVEDALLVAYSETEFFNITVDHNTEGLSDNLRVLASKDLLQSRKIDLMRDALRTEPNNASKKLLYESAPEIFDVVMEAYEVGLFKRRNFDFYFPDTYKTVSQLQSAVAERREVNVLFSEELLSDIHEAFQAYEGQKISKNDTKEKISKIYPLHGITRKVTQKTVNLYYETTNIKSSKPETWHLIRPYTPEEVKEHIFDAL